jgi:hypothetical protein
MYGCPGILRVRFARAMVLHVGFWVGFRMPAALRDGAAYSAAGVRNPPRKETALKGRRAVPQALWGFERRG